MLLYKTLNMQRPLLSVCSTAFYYLHVPPLHLMEQQSQSTAQKVPNEKQSPPEGGVGGMGVLGSHSKWWQIFLPLPHLEPAMQAALPLSMHLS